MRAGQFCDGVKKLSLSWISLLAQFRQEHEGDPEQREGIMTRIT